MRPVRSAARAMLGAIFVASGARAVANPEPLVPRAKLVTYRALPLLDAVRLPQDARTLVRLNGAAQLVGGLLLATSHFSRPAAALLAGTMIPTTVAGHPFWALDDPTERAHQRVHFMKNLGLLGGLLLAAADTEGRPSMRYTVRHGVRAVRRDARIARKSASMARHLPG
jgi:putative oxidoreductase